MKTSCQNLLYSCFLLLLFGNNCFSQESKDVKEIKKEQKEKKREMLESDKTLSTPTNRSLLNPISNISLLSTFGDEKAEANVGFKKGASQLSINISQSFEEKPKKVNFIDLDGLQTGTSVKLNYLVTFWNPKFNGDDIFEKVRQDYCDKSGIKNDSCIKITFSDAMKINELKNKLKEEVDLNLKKPIFFGIGGGFSKNSFDYVEDSLSSIYSSTSKINSNLKFSLGTFVGKGNKGILSVAMMFNSEYKGGENSYSYSFPISSKGLQITKDVTIGTPKRTPNTTFLIDYRKLGKITLTNSNEMPIGINPQISYRTKDSKLALELYLYFLGFQEDKKFAGLQGGLSVGYSKKVDKFFDTPADGMVFSIFIAKPFNLLGNIQ
jgi:hypothetical protein